MGDKIRQLFKPNRKKMLFVFTILIIALAYFIMLFIYISPPPRIEIASLISFYIFRPFLLLITLYDRLPKLTIVFLSLVGITYLFFFYILSAILSNLWNRKKFRIVIILILVIGFMIPIYESMSIFSSVAPSAPSKSRSEVIEVCNSICSHIHDERSRNFTILSSIYEYCERPFNLDVSGDRNRVKQNVFLGEGKNEIFCVDRAYCFNFPEARCYLDGEVLGPAKCLELMCKSYLKGGYSVNKSEARVKKKIKSGNCVLKKNPELGIYEKTWWEKYFEDPNCSQFLLNKTT